MGAQRVGAQRETTHRSGRCGCILRRHRALSRDIRHAHAFMSARRQPAGLWSDRVFKHSYIKHGSLDSFNHTCSLAPSLAGQSCRLARWPLVTRAGSLADDVPYPCWPRRSFCVPYSPITLSSQMISHSSLTLCTKQPATATAFAQERDRQHRPAQTELGLETRPGDEDGAPQQANAPRRASIDTYVLYARCRHPSQRRPIRRPFPISVAWCRAAPRVCALWERQICFTRT